MASYGFMTLVPDYPNLPVPRVQTKLNPWYVSGLIDAEGSFVITPTHGSTAVSFSLRLSQNSLSANVLYDLVNFFGVGTVQINSSASSTLQYVVSGHSDLLDVIVPHLLAYPLVTSKGLNSLDWMAALLVYLNKKPAPVGTTALEFCLGIKRYMNTGRSFADRFNFSMQSLATGLNPMWVLGFIDGDGCFYLEIPQRGSLVTSLEVSQAHWDLPVLHAIMAFFGAGYVSPKTPVLSLENTLVLTAPKSIFKLKAQGALEQFFDGSRHLVTQKRLDCEALLKVRGLVARGAQHTPEGLAEIKAIKQGMNSARQRKFAASLKAQLKAKL